MFEITAAPSNVEKVFDTLTPAYNKAFAQYHDQYLPLLKAKGGKVENLTSSEAAAGRNLLTAMTDYQSLYKTLYTPVNDVLPATVLETQRVLFANGAKQPVLYIFGSKAHLTTVTKKNLFSGIRSTPASLRAAGTMDYAIVYNGKTTLNSAVFATQRIPFDHVPRYLGKGLEDAEPSLTKQ